jgi:type IV pilus assembly protein PilM
MRSPHDFTLGFRLKYRKNRDLVNLTHRYPIAIDLSCPEEISAIQVTANGDNPRVCAMAQQLSTANDGTPSDADRVAFIRHVLSGHGFKGKSVALLPPLDSILSYPLRIELGKQETLEDGIVREASNALGFPLEEAVLDYASVLPDPRGKRNVSEVLVVAIRRADMQRYTRLIQEAGGRLEILESAATAIVRMHAAGSTLRAATDVLCNIGRQRSEIVVVNKDGIVAHRNINWGTNELRRKLVDNLDLEGTERDADFLIRKHGLGDTNTSDGHGDELQSHGGSLGSVSQLVTPQVAAFVHEVHSVAGYVRSRTASIAFEGVFLYGDGASIRGLAPYIQEELGIQTKAVDPFQVIDVSDRCASPVSTSNGSFALALGLALRRYAWL